MCLPVKQNTTPARSNMGHAHPRSLEQSCQGGIYYKQPILIGENKIWLTYHQRQSGFIKTQAPYLFLNHQLNHQLKGHCQEWQKYVGSPKTQGTQLSMQIKATSISDTLHSQVPSHHVQQKRLLELEASNWKEWAFTDGPILQTKKMDLILLELEFTTRTPTKSPQQILEEQASTKP